MRARPSEKASMGLVTKTARLKELRAVELFSLAEKFAVAESELVQGHDHEKRGAAQEEAPP